MKKSTPENSALVLVDHQKMTMDWIYSQDKKQKYERKKI